MRAGSRRLHRPRRGFTLLMVLALVALSSLALALAGPSWAQSLRRDRESELLRVGLLYAQALANYRDALPGSAKSYPTHLSELVRDPRIAGVMRHLRYPYPDPMQPQGEWGLVRDEYGRIVGVYSMAEGNPIRAGAVELPDRTLPAARRYADWKFLALPERQK